MATLWLWGRARSTGTVVCNTLGNNLTLLQKHAMSSILWEHIYSNEIDLTHRCSLRGAGSLCCFPQLLNRGFGCLFVCLFLGYLGSLGPSPVPPQDMASLGLGCEMGVWDHWGMGRTHQAVPSTYIEHTYTLTVSSSFPPRTLPTTASD